MLGLLSKLNRYGGSNPPTSTMNKAEETVEINIVGIKSQVPKWQDCNMCKTKLICRFFGFTYDQPCSKCKGTEAYKKKQEESNKMGGRSMDDMLKSNKVASVFQGKGTTFYVNHKGNVIKTEPIRPEKPMSIPSKRK